MNLLPLLLGFVLFKSLNNKQNNSPDLSSILSNPEIISLLPHATKLFDKNASQEEKNMAMMSLMTNPVIFEIVSKFAPPSTEQEKQNNQTTTTDDNAKQANKPGEKQQTSTDKFSQESKDFFKPVEKVAGVEISQKLYSLYDNWYIKK